MIEGLHAVWRGLHHLNRRGYVYVWANVFWAVLTVLIITAPAAWAGMVRLSYVAHRQPTVSLNDFWVGVRENLRRSVIIALANVAMFTITVSNLLSYAGADGTLIALARGIWVLSLALWLAAQYFGWCFFYAMKQPAFVGGLRNALVMMVQNPLFSLGVLLCVIVIAVISSLLPAAWFLISGGALAAIANSAVQNRLRAAGFEPMPQFDEAMVIDPHFGDI